MPIVDPKSPAEVEAFLSRVLSESPTKESNADSQDAEAQAAPADEQAGSEDSQGASEQELRSDEEDAGPLKPADFDAEPWRYLVVTNNAGLAISYERV